MVKINLLTMQNLKSNKMGLIQSIKKAINKREVQKAANEYLEVLRDRNYDNHHLDREIEVSPKAFDITLGAMWDHPRDSEWAEKQFKLMNFYYHHAYVAAWNHNAYMMKWYQGGNPKELTEAAKFRRLSNYNTLQAYQRIRDFEVNILRAENDQSCAKKPIKVCIKEDLITNFGLSIIIENFMVFNNLRFDEMQAGIGRSDPFGGEKALEAPVHTVSINQEGYAIPYGIEARHGAVFLASQTTNDVQEIGIRDSLSTRLYSRSVFPEDRIIDHVKDFDAYSINHITLLKAI